MVKKENTELPVIGWREYVDLPELGVKRIKVKVDSGARSSSLHAVDLRLFDRNGVKWATFKIYPVQRSRVDMVEVEARILEFRSVKSSSGLAQMRPVIVTDVALLGTIWPVELTLASRDNMGFRMLLGREAFRGRFFVDGGKSYYGGRTKRRKKIKLTPKFHT